MKQYVLRRTVLALAIATASSQSFAVGPVEPLVFDMTATPVSVNLEPADYSDLTIVGEAVVNDDFFELSNSTVFGQVTNNASLTGTADHLTGLDLNGSTINGNVTNTGDLTVQGLGAVGMSSDFNEVLGSISNSGNITATGAYDSINGHGATGLLIKHTNALGDTRNDGSIVANGDRAVGLQVKMSGLDGYLINGSDGTINVVGANSQALSVLDSTAAVTYNHGSLTADGLNSKAAYFDSSELRMIVNSGLMQATGEGSDGLMLRNPVLLNDANLPATSHGIVNTGTISGDEYGIVVEGPLLGDSAPLNIHMNGGLISGGSAAIKGDGQDIKLNWNSGVIDGDIDGIGDIDVKGYVTFGGDVINGNSGSRLAVASNGWLNLDAATSTITRDLDVANGGALRLYVTPETNPETPILTVGGTATFQNGSQVLLEANPFDFAPQSAGTDYKIIKAGTLVDNGLNLESMSYLLEVKDYFVNDDTLIATLAMKDYEVIEEIIISNGVDNNGRSAFMSALAILSAMDENDPVFQAIVNATPEERVEIAKQLLPELNGGSTQALVAGQNLIANVLGARADSLRSGASSGDMLAKTGVWMQALTNDADQDRRDGIDGYSADTNGFALGADGKLNDQWTVGLAYSYLESDVKSDNGNTTDVTGHTVTVYTGFEEGNWFADGSLSYSKNENEAKRHIAGTTAKGDYDSDMFGARVEGGYSFGLTQELALEPLAALRYALVTTDSYDEKGSSAALNVDSARYEALEAGLGLRLKGSFLVGSGLLKPEAKLMAYHDFAADSSSVTSTYILGGNAFTTFGASPVRDSYEAGVGATYELGNFSVGLSYDRLTKTGFDADTVTGKVRYDF